jgi:hypothetical protein
LRCRRSLQINVHGVQAAPPQVSLGRH